MSLKGTKNPNYKDGRSLKDYFCVDCKKKLKSKHAYQHKRCGSCSSRKNTLERYDKIERVSKPACIDCGKPCTRTRCLSCLYKSRKGNFISGEKNPMHGKTGELNHFYGKEHTTESKNKISKANKKASTTLYNRLKACSQYSSWRLSILQRDNFTCVKCGQTGGILDIDHIRFYNRILSEFLDKYKEYDPIKDKEILFELALSYKPFWDINNGRTLCRECHKQRHKEEGRI